ncbi:M56 family metallopeptidase [Pedobacter aquatilis]|uniref:M56 family metallopeptidase n=1 Tax=Pedobacter aquatilis TaxID=351343 RepID=UPI00292DE50B|nr:M56 family metallopeptidase [Pedobacter aquatilis]
MELLTYLLKVSACTALFFAFYLLVLRRLTFFTINRFYLLSTLLLSFVIPALQFRIERELRLPEVEVPVTTTYVQQYTIEQPQAVQVMEMPVEQMGIDWLALIPFVYLAIVAILLAVFTWQLLQLLRHASKYASHKNGLKLVHKVEGFTNCSFFNYVFVSESTLSEEDMVVLLKHEAVHAAKYHSIDKIVLMISKAFLWFNPVIYFFDKALEQTHEYEADELTSQQFGTNAYAKLILRLAISKSEVPLIHNFVKSPVKQRIKMLFNSKSANMKKLVYLLALPVALSLFWVFSVAFVYAQTKPATGIVQQDTSKVKPSKNKELALPNVKQTDPYFTSEDYYEKQALSRSVSGKTIIGIVKGDYKSKLNHSFDDGKLFESAGKTFIIPAMYLGEENMKRLKANDELKIVSHVSFFNKGGDYVYIQPKQIFSGDKLIYQMPKTQVQPFAYEANKVRFNDGIITEVAANGDKKIINVEANDFNFKVTVNKSQTDLSYLNDYKKGDNVRLRFIHEVKTGAKSYAIKDWVSISKNIMTFGVQNKVLFSRFYQEDGRQKFAEIKKTVINLSQDTLRPKFLSSAKITGNVKEKISYLENAVVLIAQDLLRAKYVEYNDKSNILVAKDASLEINAKSKIFASQIVFDFNKRTYTANTSDGEKIEANFGVYNQSQKKLSNEYIQYSASDSVRFSKDKSIISLYGKANIIFNDMKIEADEIIYNDHTKSGTAKNLLVTTNKGMKMKGKTGKFNMKGEIEIWQVDGSYTPVER